jgi:hypothetical protein
VIRWAETPILITESKIKLIRYLLIAYSLFYSPYTVYTVEEIKKLKTVKDAKFSGSDLWVKYEGGELHSFALSLSPDLTNDTSAQAEPDHLNY